MSSFVVRELINLFVTKIDESSFNTVERRINGLANAVKAVAAGYLGKELFEMAESAARFEDARLIFQQAGGDLVKLRKETKGLVNDFDLVKSFNMAQQFGFSEYLSRFVIIAHGAAKKFGISQEEALRRIIRGTARGSAPILDDLGIQLVGQRQKILDKYAGRLGKNRKDLTGKEMAKAYAEAVVEQSKNIVAEANRAGATFSDKFSAIGTATENLALSVGGFLDQAGGPFAQWAVQTMVDLRGFFEVLKDPEGAGPDAVARFGELADGVRTFGAFLRAGYRALKGFLETGLGKFTLGIVAALVATRTFIGPLSAIGSVATASTTPINALAAALGFQGEAALAAAAKNALWGAGFLALGLILFAIGEEIAAIIDTDAEIDSFFGKWSGHWKQFELAVLNSEDPSDSPFLKGLKASLEVIAFLADRIDTDIKNIKSFIDWKNNIDAQGDPVEGMSPLDLATADQAVQIINARKAKKAYDTRFRGQDEFGPGLLGPPFIGPSDFGTGMSLVAPVSADGLGAGQSYGVASEPQIINNVQIAFGDVGSGVNKVELTQIVNDAVDEGITNAMVEAKASTRPAAK